jgi:SAM-dependent methyltransferase
MHAQPRVLVIGGGILGKGMQRMVDDERIDLVESDIFLGPRTAVLFDAHSIPFEDESFDAIVCQAVLEHVADPFRCVDEFARVLRPGGLVYAGTAFMQQVHGGAHDFMRFSLVGHRRLFRRFEEIESGMAVGPGSGLAWSWRYFLGSFAKTRQGSAIGQAVGRLTGFVWARFDPYLARRPGATDAASAVYFVGAKGPDGWALSDREVVASYRGLRS